MFYKFLLTLFFSFSLFATDFKVASYNVENLFDEYSQGTEYSDYKPNRHNWDSKMVDIKLNHTAQVICDIDADIIGLQEIENINILKRLVKKLQNVGCKKYNYAISSKRGSAVQVALLSVYPIVKKKNIRSRYGRDILEATLDIKGNPLTIFVNHWKSKGRGGYESKRVLSAKTLQKRIKSFSKEIEYIILGDLNSEYDLFRHFEKRLNNTNGVTGINDILKTKIGNRLIRKSEISLSSWGTHFSTWLELPINKRWSHNFYGKKGALDHILLPKTLFNGKGIEYKDKSFKVFRDKYLFKKGRVYRWQYKNKKHLGKGYSDHLPIVASFTTNSTKRFETKEPIKEIIEKKGDIELLYDIHQVKEPILLKDVAIIFKRRFNAIAKESKNSRGIFLYNCAKELKEGYKYDIMVQKISNYYGLTEITNFYVIEEKGKINKFDFYKKELKGLEESEVLIDLVGYYYNKELFLPNSRIKTYFKKSPPPNGSKVYINYAHLGFYKKMVNLIVYNKSDFKVLKD